MKSADKGKPAAEGQARRRWIFRGVALLAPVVLLLFVEAALRVFGVGYPVTFFIPDEPGILRENPDFARRYFPPQLHRSPNPMRFEVAKAEDEYRVFVFGESAAMGDPDSSYGFSRILEVLLRERFPGKPFRVVNVAFTAINSHVIRDIARECAEVPSRFWLVYMGNNEVVGPFGAGTVFGKQVPELGMIRMNLALKKTRLGQLLGALGQNSDVTPKRWGGMEMFLDQRVSKDDPRLTKVYDHFGHNLEEIIQEGVGAGNHVLVGTVGVNLKDFPPFSSVEPVANIEQWTEHFEEGVRSEASGEQSDALRHYQAAHSIDASSAELGYRLGRVSLAVGKVEEARNYFAGARDMDSLRFRADSSINQLIRDTVSRQQNDSVVLVDLEQACEEGSARGIAGSQLFHEHVHFTFQGNYLVAVNFLKQMEAKLAPALSPAGRILGARECQQRLAWTRWDQLRLMQEVIARLELAPFSHQLDHQKRQAHRRERYHSHKAAYDERAFQSDWNLYREAIKRRSDDWVLVENVARFLDANGKPADAETQWRQLTQLMPHHAPAFFGLGSCLQTLGKTEEALPLLNAALALRPDAPEARTALGLALAQLGRNEDAKREYQRVIESHPDFAEARINLGQLWGGEGNVEAAKREYVEVLRWQSNNVPARINLGKLLSDSGDFAGAKTHYQEAVRIEPGNAVVHYNLGNAVRSMGGESVQHYVEAVRLDGTLIEARYNLGLELASDRRYQEAEEQLRVVVEAKPEFIAARMNLGVLFVKTSRISDAISQFEAILKREPSNAAAARYLKQAQQLDR